MQATSSAAAGSPMQACPLLQVHMYAASYGGLPAAAAVSRHLCGRQLHECGVYLFDLWEVHDRLAWQDVDSRPWLIEGWSLCVWPQG